MSLANLREAEQHYSGLLQLGEEIARRPNHVLYENPRTGEKYTIGEALEGMAPGKMRALTALMMENTRREFAALDESTRLMHIGSFEKYAFPMVRVVLPSLVSHNLVSVQPMAGPTSLVFYMQFLYSRTKGSAVGGRNVVENPNEYYSDETIDAEVVGVGTGATPGPYTPSLSYTPVKPGTLKITCTISSVDYDITDNGNGVLTGAILAAPGTINYATGALSFTYTGNPDAGTSIISSYAYDMEGNTNIPEVDLALVSTPVVAKTRKLRTKWSLEAQADFRNLHGLEAELELVAMLANEIKFETDREQIRNLKRFASGSMPSAWSKTPGTGISFTEHKLSFIDQLIAASNVIYKATQRAKGTWIVCGINVDTVIESLPGFKSSGVILSGTRGVYHAGTLNGRWEVFVDANYADNEYLVGYKGETMWETGYVFAPYVPIYTTPTVMLDDFLGRKGIASRYGQKAVDPRFYCKGSITT